EARRAALVGAVRSPSSVHGGEEEHRHALDELAVTLREPGVDDGLLQAVRQAAGVEGVLQLAARLVVDALASLVGHGHGSPPRDPYERKPTPATPVEAREIARRATATSVGRCGLLPLGRGGA